jgi:hypothetical protein
MGILKRTIHKLMRSGRKKMAIADPIGKKLQNKERQKKIELAADLHENLQLLRAISPPHLPGRWDKLVPAAEGPVSRSSDRQRD